MIIAVFIGGGMGAVLRYLLSLCLSKWSLIFPFQTLAANFIGCFIAGAAGAFIISKTGINPLYKLLIITGFCGGLTTFSTFSLEVLNFIQSGESIKALIYAVLSFIVCLFAALIGILSVKKFI